MPSPASTRRQKGRKSKAALMKRKRFSPALFFYKNRVHALQKEVSESDSLLEEMQHILAKYQAKTRRLQEEAISWH
eukprot:1821896-Prorocentrum_lima.AAC.1